MIKVNPLFSIAKNLLENWGQLAPATAPPVTAFQRYFNWDDDEDREKLLTKHLPFQPGPIVSS